MAQKKTYIYRVMIGKHGDIFEDIFMYARNADVAISYCREQFKTIYPEIKRSSNPHEYYVDLTKKLLELKKQLILESREQFEVSKQYKKVK